MYSLLRLMRSRIKSWPGRFIVFSISLQPLEVQQYSLYETTKLYTVIVLLLVIVCLMFAKIKDNDRRLKKIEERDSDIVYKILYKESALTHKEPDVDEGQK